LNLIETSSKDRVTWSKGLEEMEPEMNKIDDILVYLEEFTEMTVY